MASTSFTNSALKDRALTDRSLSGTAYAKSRGMFTSRSSLVATATAWAATLGRRLTYLMVGFPLSLAAFIVMMVGLPTGLGTLITFIGFPILLLTLSAARGFATVERTMLVSLVDMEPIPEPVPADDASAGLVERVKGLLTDRQSWLNVAHGVVGFPVSVFTWAVAVAWCVAAVAGPSAPIWLLLTSDGPDGIGPLDLLGAGAGYLAQSVTYVVIGLLALVTLPVGVFGAAWLRATVARSFLIDPVVERAKVSSLTEGRDAARSAEAGTFRRLERDIHDGPQQRLVRLSMDLGRAEMKASGSDPELKEALADAKRQTTDALEELRALSRGIAPPVLVDRGLLAALEELVQRSPVPTTAEIDLTQDRFESHVESAVYFFVSEALTNVAKHALASHASVKVLEEDGHVWITITDDGAGGAEFTDGHGLSGLRQRLRSVDGHMELNSPLGGPTVLVAEVPCA